MEQDFRLRRLAERLAARYGDDTLAVVIERLRARLRVQDYAQVARWAQLADAVRRLLPEAKPERGLKRTQQPLAELMDDPVMTAVVQDDDERRREIHDTLSRAKRKLQRKG